MCCECQKTIKHLYSDKRRNVRTVLVNYSDSQGEDVLMLSVLDSAEIWLGCDESAMIFPVNFLVLEEHRSSRFEILTVNDFFLCTLYCILYSSLHLMYRIADCTRLWCNSSLNNDNVELNQQCLKQLTFLKLSQEIQAVSVSFLSHQSHVCPIVASYWMMVHRNLQDSALWCHMYPGRAVEKAFIIILLMIISTVFWVFNSRLRAPHHDNDRVISSRYAGSYVNGKSELLWDLVICVVSEEE